MSGKSNQGADTVVDFAPNHDDIDLRGWNLSSFTNVQPLLFNAGANVIIDLDGAADGVINGDATRLEGIADNDLDASDFIL